MAEDNKQLVAYLGHYLAELIISDPRNLIGKNFTLKLTTRTQRRPSSHNGGKLFPPDEILFNCKKIHYRETDGRLVLAGSIEPQKIDAVQRRYMAYRGISRNAVEIVVYKDYQENGANLVEFEIYIEG